MDSDFRMKEKIKLIFIDCRPIVWIFLIQSDKVLGIP